MSSSDSVSASACAPAPLPWYRTKWVATAIRFIILGVLCGWFYGWATSIFYPKQGPAGFSHGMVHGAVMPMAMPSLIMGKDVVIYAPNNTGITYKLGYTVGINVCGIIFFGFGFGGIKIPKVQNGSIRRHHKDTESTERERGGRNHG